MHYTVLYTSLHTTSDIIGNYSPFCPSLIVLACRHISETDQCLNEKHSLLSDLTVLTYQQLMEYPNGCTSNQALAPYHWISMCEASAPSSLPHRPRQHDTERANI
jgi:hypothetical protein